MITFVDEILADIEWRMSELAAIKSIPIKYSLRPEHRNIHLKYSVPAIYAIWEGFVKSCFTVYSNHLNGLEIKRSEIATALLTHRVDTECGFNNPRVNFESKQKLVKIIDNLLSDVIIIKPSVPTESNVNLKVLNNILDRFCISHVDQAYNNGLNRLLWFRNAIAHGENSVLVNMSHITEFVSLIEDLMLDITINIEKSEKCKSYRKDLLAI